ncbi:MAG: PilZ domain-containing protein [Phycisphaerales bacterium]
MFNTKNQQNFDSIADAGELIDELSKSTSDTLKQMRNSTRLNLRIKVFVEPASLSARLGVQLQGITGDISVGGTQILLARPLNIGDVYQLSFDRSEFDLAPVYAVCLRGRLVRADAYEAGMRFLEAIELPQVDGSKVEGLI